MRAKNSYGGEAVITALVILQEAEFYETFPTLKPTQVGSVRGEHDHRIYKDIIKNIKYAFLRANTK